MKTILLFFVALFISLFSNLSFCQVNLNNIGIPYIQNFDAMYYNWTPYVWQDNTNIPGWYSNRTGYIADYGNSNSGGLHCYFSSGSYDLSLGGLSSSATSPSFALRLKNNTSSIMTSFNIYYTGEQWRQNSPKSLNFDYQVGANSISVGTWTPVSALNFNALKSVPNGTLAGPIDGNAVGNKIIIASTIVATVAPGQEIWLRWSMSGTNSPGLAIDDFSVTPQAPAITNYYSKPFLELNNVETWGTNNDGSGTSPIDFISDYQVFNIRNNASPFISSAWTVSGAGSKIVLGDGSPISLIIPAGSPITGIIDACANANLELQEINLPTFGTIDNSSSVNFAQSSGSVVIPVGNYGNLKLTNGNKTMAPNTINISGDLIVDGVTDFNGGPSPFTEINLLGNFTLQNSTFSADNNNRLTINCNGTYTQIIQGNGSIINVFRITVKNAAGVELSTLGGSTNIVAGNAFGGGITMNSGNLLTHSNTITLFHDYIPAIFTETSGKYIIGNVVATKHVGFDSSTVGNLLGVSPYIKGIADGPDDLGDVTVTRVTGNDGIITVGGKSGIKCNWTITSSNPPVNGRNITFAWQPPDDNGKDLTTASIWQSNDVDGSWNKVGIETDASATHTITLTGVTSFSKFTVSDDPNPLPVELSSFTSNINGRNVNLNWSTQTEKNSDNFLVERKTSSTNWESIGSIKAAVLSNSPKYYSFTDRNLGSGKFDYRIKMIDNDGTFAYSKIIETEIAIPKYFNLSQNYPNPFNPSTKISYNIPFDSKVTLEVYNISGESICQLVNEEQSAGYYSVDFNSSVINKNISTGVYFYRIIATNTSENNFSSIKKMILLK